MRCLYNIGLAVPRYPPIRQHPPPLDIEQCAPGKYYPCRVNSWKPFEEKASR